MAQVTCTRCGFSWEIQSPRRAEYFCASCKSGKVQTIQGELGKCLPWHGRFGEDLTTPIDDDGLLVVPGIRMCGRLDCVSPRHVIPAERMQL